MKATNRDLITEVETCESLSLGTRYIGIPGIIVPFAIGIEVHLLQILWNVFVAVAVIMKALGSGSS